MRSAPLALTAEERTAITGIETLARSASVQLLLERLIEPRWTVRRAAVDALGRLGEAALPALTTSLRTARDDETRIAAVVDALVASRGDVETVASAIAATHPPAPLLCDLAQILGRRGQAAAAPLLRELVAHEDDNVSAGAIEALARIDADLALEPVLEAAASRRFFRTFPAIAVLAGAKDRRALALLVELSGEPAYADEAVRALGRSRHPEALRALVRMLPDASGPTSAVVAEAIVSRHHGDGAAGVEAAVASAVPPPLLLARLQELADLKDPIGQLAICRLLAWVRPSDAVAPLVQLLSCDHDVAAGARDALASIGPAAHVELARALGGASSAALAGAAASLARRSDASALGLGLTDPDPEVRTRACEAIARVGDAAGVGSLFPLLGDPDLHVASAALHALQTLGGDETARQALAATSSPDARVRRAALRLLVPLRPAGTLAALLAATTDPDPRVSEAALIGLGASEDTRATDALLEAASGPSSRARGAAVRALGHRQRDQVAVAMLRERLTDPDPWVRYYACQAIGNVGDVGADEALTARVNDSAGQVQVAAVLALVRLGTPRALEAIRAATTSADLDVRRAAVEGVAALEGAAVVEAEAEAEPAAISNGHPRGGAGGSPR